MLGGRPIASFTGAQRTETALAPPVNRRRHNTAVYALNKSVR